MQWTQIYDPFHSQTASQFVAFSPILFMFILLAIVKVRGHIAGILTMGFTTAMALFWGLPPLQTAMSAIYGFGYGLFPIVYIIFPAFLLYNLVVESGHFQQMRYALETLTPDRRLQVLLIGFCFTAFLDSTAGFVAPVAISTSILVSIGFPSLTAAGLSLLQARCLRRMAQLVFLS